MKKTRTIHYLYLEWRKLPKELRCNPVFNDTCIVGKWHYHYENQNGKISVVRFNHQFIMCNKKPQHHIYETCGTMDYAQFNTLYEAEAAIYKKLKEKIQNH